MKIEYLENTGDELYSNVLRIYAFNDSETIQLMDLIAQIDWKETAELKIHALPFVQSINCQLTLKFSKVNSGLSQINPQVFEWFVDVKHKEEICLMLQHSISSNGFYWLDGDVPSDICLLFSQSGGW